MTNTIKVPLIKHCTNIFIFATKRDKINFPSCAQFTSSLWPLLNETD